MASPAHRFEVLDSWRGLSACLVALFHLQAYSHFYGSSLLRHSFLFVDFFFVLSGFVIVANYRDKLLSGYSPWEFMLLRFGRIYPLHVAILAGLIGLELARYQFDGLLSGSGQKFAGPTSVAAIFSNLLLVQSLGVHDGLTWNLPSWSISVEFYAYIVFAVALLCLRSRIYLFIAFVGVAAPAFLLYRVGHIDTQYDFGIVRCVLGFFVGFVCYDVYLLLRRHGLQDAARSSVGNVAVATVIEAACLTMIIAFVCFCGDGPLSVAAPAVFGIAVLVFSIEGGVLSRILRARPFMLLGMLSYSIYMVHMPVQLAMRYALQIGERLLRIPLFREGQLGAELWQGDLCYVICLGLLVAVSYVTYHLIEQPGRRNSRALARWFFSSDAAAKPTVSAVSS